MELEEPTDNRRYNELANSRPKSSTIWKRVLTSQSQDIRRLCRYIRNRVCWPSDATQLEGRATKYPVSLPAQLALQFVYCCQSYRTLHRQLQSAAAVFYQQVCKRTVKQWTFAHIRWITQLINLVNLCIVKSTTDLRKNSSENNVLCQFSFYKLTHFQRQTWKLQN